MVVWDRVQLVPRLGVHLVDNVNTAVEAESVAVVKVAEEEQRL